MLFVHYLRLLRVKQYVKNLLIFAPLFFSARFDEPLLAAKAGIAFLGFSLIASAVYVFNDLLDVEDDRLHPIKRNRPLANGSVSPGGAKAVMAASALVGLAISFAVSGPTALYASIYMVLNAAYCWKLKHIAVIDISIVAVGFVLRLFVGSAAVDIPLSMWIMVITYLLASFLALSKRRDDILIFLDSGQKTRKTVDGYNLEFLNAAMAALAAVVIVAYIQYTRSVEVIERIGSDALYLTTPLVVIGILRYMQTVFVKRDSGNPVRILFKDGFLLGTVLFWALIFGWILYRSSG